tara:strand:+ start:1384 stop:2409 length:1026 start_codon:yes stop_codon:yes gene_type:complete
MAYTTIDDPTINFNTKIYTGTGSSNSVTGVNFQPDFVWIKDRSEGNWHNLYDVIRGATKRLFSNQTNAEETQAAALSAFGSDGFTVGSNVDVNKSSNNYVSWNWKAGGSASSNGDGNIASSVSANTAAGFSIATWTGSGSNGTIGHGLGAAPELSFIKQRTGTQDWNAQATALGYSKYLILNGSNASANTSGAIISSVSTTTISVDSNGYVNAASNNYVGYFFASVQGHSKIGIFTGNGNADGPYVHLGFRPAWVLFKPVSSADWTIVDAKRNTFNPVADKTLNPNLDSAEHDGSADLDFLSGGFKIKNANTDTNDSGTILYMAFAESPFVNSNGVPTNAR